MKISVIVPTYKPQEYIWECLNSIKNQTFARDDFELILVLNGCNDPYYSKIKDFIIQHFNGYNINFIQTDIGGVSNARNIALDIAKGEYVTFIDDDDYISPQYLEELYQQASPSTVSLCYPYAFNDGKPEIQLEYGLTNVYNKFHKRAFNTINSNVRKYFSGPCMKLLHRDIIRGRRFDIRFKNGEDSLYMFLISDNIYQLSFTSQTAIYYRRYRNNSAVMKHRSKKERILNNYKCIIEYTRIFMNGGYSLYFYISRIVAELRCIIKAIISAKL